MGAGVSVERHSSAGKHQRQAAKSKRRARKRRRALDRERRREAREEHGREGWRSCGRKVRYPHELAATRAALSAMRRGAPPLWVYPCRFCDGWHLTSHPRGDGTEA